MDNPYGSHGQTQSVSYRLPIWAQGRTHMVDLYMGSEWVNTYVDLMANPYESHMSKHNQTHICCPHEPKVGHTWLICIWVLNG